MSQFPLKQVAIKAGTKTVRVIIIQIHHKTIKAATLAKVVATITGATMTISAATISKDLAAAQCVQTIIISGATHTEIATIVLQITTALVSVNHLMKV